MTKRASTCATAVLLALVLSGCTGSPESTSSWSDKADKAVGQATSSLGTAQVVLEAEKQDHLTGSYGVGTLTDAVETLEGAVSKFDTAQPPDTGHELARSVIRTLHDATQLLVEVRTAYASPRLHDPEASALLDLVKRSLTELDRLSSKLSEAAR